MKIRLRRRQEEPTAKAPERPTPIAPVAPGMTAGGMTPPRPPPTSPGAAPVRGRDVGGGGWQRLALGSLGVVLGLGVWVGRATGQRASVPSHLELTGAGHLLERPVDELLRDEGMLAGADAVRERILATGVVNEVVVHRRLPASFIVEAVEKRAVGLLDLEPLAAVAADGTLLGPAAVRDLEWAGANDLVLIRGADPEAPDFSSRTRLAGRLAAGLRARPTLDRAVSEVDLSREPYRIEAVLRPAPIRLLLTSDGFFDQLERGIGLLRTLTGRWPDLARVDLRAPDRVVVRSGPAPLISTDEAQGPGEGSR